MFFPILVVGSFGPFLAAFSLKLREGGLRAAGEFAGRALRFRIGLPYLLCALLLLPLIGAAATEFNAMLGGPHFALAVPIGQIPSLFVLMFFLGGSVGEEFGWAYATDVMLARWRPIVAIVALGLIWSCWHIPLFFIAGTSQSHLPFWMFMIAVASMRIMYAWAYQGTKKSILTTLLFHTSGNMAFNLFMLVSYKGTDQRLFLIFALLSFAAAVAIAIKAPFYRNKSALGAEARPG